MHRAGLHLADVPADCSGRGISSAESLTSPDSLPAPERPELENRPARIQDRVIFDAGGGLSPNEGTMKAREFPGNGLSYTTIEPDDYQPGGDYPVVIMIHGYASSMQEIARLAPRISRDGYIYACPNAPISFQVRSGRIAYGWSSPGSSPEQVEREEVSAAESLEPFFTDVFERYQVRPQQVLLMGFSQGGSLSLRCGLPRPEIFAGLASLSGYLPEAGALRERLPVWRNQPIFVAHGINDQYIPLDDARAVRAFLESQEYSPTYKEYPMRHEIAQLVLDDLEPWIKQVLAPYGTGTTHQPARPE
jgi:phospholipase/carboxylesterase